MKKRHRRTRRGPRQAGERIAAPRPEGLELPRPFPQPPPGARPGIEPHELDGMPSEPGSVRISCLDYSAEQSRLQQIEDVQEFVSRHRPEWCAVRWINVDGIGDLGVVRALAEKYHLHPLAIEDLLRVPERPKVDVYEASGEHQARVFIVARMIELQQDSLISEQISIFLGHKTVLTFQEGPGDVWDPIRQRLQAPGSRLRGADASFLVYTLIDAIIDHCFPILEHYGDRLEDLEDLILERPTRAAIEEIHRLKRDLLLLRRAVWPMREVVSQLQRESHECLSDSTHTYLRDVQDHTVQIIDLVETYREVAVALTETYMTSVNNRMSEIMKVLTIMSTIFVPLTFLAGVYGMNFHNFPELKIDWAYPAFWGVCLVSSLGMLAWFRHRGWL